MSYADRVCNLECVKANKSEGVKHEFVGPVKIILVDPSPQEYQRKAWASAFYTFAMLLMGATVFTVFFYTLTFKLPLALNAHVLLCTMGFQLFLPSGMLMFNSLFGGSAYLKPADKFIQHIFLQVCAIGCCVTGCAFVIYNGMIYTTHSSTGLAATVLILGTSVIGLTVYISNRNQLPTESNKIIHISLALLTFILSTISFIFGLLRESFIKWEPVQNLHFILIAFIVIYSTAIILSIFMKSKYGL